VTYTTDGLKTVSLTVTGPGGTDTETKTDYIAVSLPGGPPVANFTATPRSGTAPLNVQFTDISAGDITSWSWDFGSGASPATADTQGPHSVTYSTEGAKTVSLTATGSGGSDEEIRADYIHVCICVGIIYVDGSRPGDSGDGLSWTTAKKYIQSGINASTDGWAVFVANGTYTGIGNKDLNFNGKAIHLRSAGGAENCIIDCENSGRGFYFGSGEDANSIVEGLTIKKGAADGGGAVECYYSSPKITDCTFSENFAMDGGAVYCHYSSSPTITNCTFSENSADFGGAVDCAYSSSPAITNCTFSENYGGAVYCSFSSSPTITDCTFSANFGGAVDCYSYSSTTITNCTFSGNSGGAVSCSDSSPTITITNCAFSGNSAESGYGAAVDCSDSSLTITNCTFSGNSTVNGGAVYCYSSSLTITDCAFSGNSAGSDGGAVDCGSSTTITNCTFSENGAYDGGAVSCGSSTTITNCTFSGNSAVETGGAVRCSSSSPIITNCTFSENSAGWIGRGGAVYCGESSPTITNCTFSENSAGWYGGAVFCEFSSSPTITNCTFSRNSAVNYGGAVYCDFSSPTINNSILWNNSATSGGNEIYIFYLPSYPSSVTLNNCDVMSGGYGGETGNITENSCMHPDPLFVDAAGGNYHLQAGSPCIDAGDNSLVPPGVTTDLDGNPRIYPEGGTVDMGAYEYQP
jgi:parallel beta-helix repeat protein/predicted outer membrane repeat protein